MKKLVTTFGEFCELIFADCHLAKFCGIIAAYLPEFFIANFLAKINSAKLSVAKLILAKIYSIKVTQTVFHI